MRQCPVAVRPDVARTRASLCVDHRHAAARPADTHAPDAALQGKLGATGDRQEAISPSISIPSNRSRTGTSSTVCGSHRARPFDGSANALPASLQHHERWDSFSGTNRLCSPRWPQTTRTVCADRGRSRPQWGRSRFHSCHACRASFFALRAYAPHAEIIVAPVLYGTGPFGPLVYWSVAPLRARSEHPVRGMFRVRDLGVRGWGSIAPHAFQGCSQSFAAGASPISASPFSSIIVISVPLILIRSAIFNWPS